MIVTSFALDSSDYPHIAYSSGHYEWPLYYIFKDSTGWSASVDEHLKTSKNRRFAGCEARI